MNTVAVKSRLKDQAALKKKTPIRILLDDLKRNKGLYLMVLPVILFYLMFAYKPMYGAIIAFKHYEPAKGILGSPWVGFKYFEDFFSGFYFWRILKNTFVISASTLIFSFPAPIILALLINELKNKFFTKTVQTITYLPHFISIVVIAGMIKDFTSSNGIINDIIVFFGGERMTMLTNPKMFVGIYTISDIWQGVGWGSIIYLAALAAIDQELYEACTIDGGGRLRQIIHITIPGILPTIITLFILRMGSILNVGFEKIILLYNPSIYETADVISSFVYRKGLQEFNWGYSAAVGLFNSLINVIFLVAANKISKKVTESSLW